MASHPLLENSAEICDGGHAVGRDPANVLLSDLHVYHSIKNPVKAIRAQCLDCSGGCPSEARKCVSVTCPLWPFRMGRNPFRTKRVMSDAERARRAAQLNPPTSPKTEAPPRLEPEAAQIQKVSEHDISTPPNA